MKKRIFASVCLLLILFMSLGLSGCNKNKIKENSDYITYYYDYTLGDFIPSDIYTLSFKDDTYNLYIDNQLYSIGTYRQSENMISLLPDKIGEDKNVMERIESCYVYKNYIIPVFYYSIFQRLPETYNSERDKLEGIYVYNDENYIKLKDNKIYDVGKCYDTYNNYLSPDLYTYEIGTYTKNSKDFIVLDFYDDGVAGYPYLLFEYIDDIGRTVSCLTDIFFSNKEVKFEPLKFSFAEVNNKFFIKNEQGIYNFTLREYPSKKTITDFKINNIYEYEEIEINGTSIKCTEPGSYELEFEYNGIKFTDDFIVLDNLQVITDNDGFYDNYILNEALYLYDVVKDSNYLNHNYYFDISFYFKANDLVMTSDTLIFTKTGTHDITFGITITAWYEDNTYVFETMETSFKVAVE